MNRLPFLLVAWLLALGTTAPADDRPIKGDLAKLQGGWTGRTGRDGIYQTLITIRGHRLSIANLSRDGLEIGASTKIEINELAKPYKTLDQSDIFRYGGTGKGADHVYGIYEFVDDDTLKLCNGFEKRPTEFKDGPAQMLCIFKREASTDSKPKK